MPVEHAVRESNRVLVGNCKQCSGVRCQTEIGKKIWSGGRVDPERIAVENYRVGDGYTTAEDDRIEVLEIADRLAECGSGRIDHQYFRCPSGKLDRLAGAGPIQLKQGAAAQHQGAASAHAAGDLKRADGRSGDGTGVGDTNYPVVHHGGLDRAGTDHGLAAGHIHRASRRVRTGRADIQRTAARHGQGSRRPERPDAHGEGRIGSNCHQRGVADRHGDQAIVDEIPRRAAAELPDIDGKLTERGSVGGDRAGVDENAQRLQQSCLGGGLTRHLLGDHAGGVGTRLRRR